MSRDELFVTLAVRAKLLTASQIEDAKKLQAILSENGFTLSLPEILAKKEYLNADQVRLLNLAVRYEDARRDDHELGNFLVRNGFVAEEKVRDCLNAQELDYLEGRLFPRLKDLLVDRAHMSLHQFELIERARRHIEPARKPSSAMLPSLKSFGVPAPAALKPLSSQRVPAPLDPKAMAAGLSLDSLKVAYRRNTLPEGPSGPLDISTLDLEGLLDGHTFKKFAEYLNGIIDAGIFHVILNCEKLDYVSSAGIGILAGATKRCRDAGGDLRLSGVQEKVLKVISLVGLQSLLRMYDNERGAVLSFKFQ